MKNKKTQRLTFQKKSITELQPNESVDIDGGHITVGITDAIRKITELGKPTRHQ